MTVNDKARFMQAFNRLAVAVRLPADQTDAAMQRVYWDGLADIPLEAVEDAARDLALDAQWFPKLSEWRTLAEKAKHGRMLKAALPSPRDEPWKAECETCDDTGWEFFVCPAESPTCERVTPHLPHSYTRPCYCRPTNRTYQRRLAEQHERVRGRHEAVKQARSSRSGSFTRVGEP